MVEKKKPETIFRTFRTIVIKADDQDEGVIDILIPMSTASTDRHGESIDPKGWKKSLKEFKKRAILLSSHNYGSLQNQIGELLDLQVVEEGLLSRPKYYINQGNPEADWAYFLASKGMAAFSVGFIPIKWEDSDGKDGKPSRTFTEQELIEISQVTVPSNRDAIMGLQAKGFDDPVISDIIAEVLEDKEFFKAEEDQEVKTIIKEALEGREPDPIDPEKLKAEIEKDEDENEYKKGWLEGYAGFEAMTETYLVPYLSSRKQMIISNVLFEELKEQLADFELKAGAVLNAKNKGNLKQAQLLIQAVLDSAGTEEEGLEDEGEGGEIIKKADTVITITDTKKEDPPKDEAIKEKTITIDDKLLKAAIAKALNYTLGITDK